MPSVKSIDQVSISPNGAQVAYIVGGELSVAATANGLSRRIAPSQNTTRDVSWSADSHYLAWLNDIPGDKPASQLWSASVDSSELTQRASFDGYAQAPRYSPNGKTISVLYLADMPRVAGPLQPMTPLSGVIGSKIYEQRISTVDLATNKLQQMSPGDVYIYEYDWLPDSSGWVGTAAHGSGDNNWWIARLYAIDAFNGHMREIYKPKWQIAEPHVSPGGAFTKFDVPETRQIFSATLNQGHTVIRTYADASFVIHSFQRTAHGAVTAIDAPGAGTSFFQGTFVSGINSAGTITGHYTDMNYVAHGFVWGK